MNQEHESWFRKAENDLLAASNNLKAEEVPADTVCFHSQQAAEKYLKGFLTHHGVKFERIHNLNLILFQCIEINNEFEQLKDAAQILNLYSVIVRYPNFIDETEDANEPNLEEAQSAFELALSVKSFVIQHLP